MLDLSLFVVVFLTALVALFVGMFVGVIVIYAEWHNADAKGKSYHDKYPIGNGCMWNHNKPCPTCGRF